MLAFSAIQNKDKIGVIFFSDRVEKFIPAKKGRSHILRIVRELLDFTPQHKGTRISAALDYLNSVVKKRAICFLISDFQDEGFENALRIASRKHDVVALRVFDRHERMMPDLGLVRMIDNETGEEVWVNTGSRSVRRKFQLEVQAHEDFLKSIFIRSGVDTTSITTDENYVRPLMNLFKRRA